MRVEDGAVWGDVDHATHAFGLATPCGFISTTGVGGLTLGGGSGYLTRKHGLTVDNLLSADVVLTDGGMVTADADQHADLFWALGGGRENFGIVTSFLLHGAHELPCLALQSSFDPLYPAGLEWYRRADYFGTLSGHAIREHARHGATLPTPHSTMHLYPVNGASARVPADATAYRHRDAMWSQVIVGVDPDPARADELRDWTVGYYDALHRVFHGGGVHQLHDGGGGESRAGQLRAELRAPGAGQAPLRPEELLPRQPEHRAGRMSPDRVGPERRTHPIRCRLTGRRATPA